MRYINTYLLIIYFLSLQLPLLAHDDSFNNQISGKVSCNGEALPYASIYIKGTSIGAATDSEGQFILSRLPEGKFTIVVSAVGYSSVEKQVSISKTQRQELYFELKESMITTDEVVVSASRNGVKRKDAPVLVNTISPGLLENIHANNLADGLNFTPGLRMENDCQNCGFTQVRLNGLDGSYSQILINSRPIFSNMAGVYGLEQIPVNMQLWI